MDSGALSFHAPNFGGGVICLVFEEQHGPNDADSSTERPLGDKHARFTGVAHHASVMSN